MIGDTELTIEYAAEFLQSLYVMGKIAQVRASFYGNTMKVSVITWNRKYFSIEADAGRESPLVQRMVRSVLTEIAMDEIMPEVDE